MLERIAKKSEGCVRDAVSLLDQLMGSGAKKITPNEARFILPTTSLESQLQFVSYCMHAQIKDGLTFINTLVSNGISLPQFATDLIELLRIMLIYQVDPKLAAEEMNIAGKLPEELKLAADTITPHSLINLIDLTMRRAGAIKSAPLPQLPLEMLIIEWSTRSPQAPNSTPANGSLPTVEITKTINELANPLHPTVELAKTLTPELHKKTFTEKVKELVQSSPVTKIQVENAWGSFMERLEQKYPSLIYLLKMAKLKEVAHGTISIGVQYSFHQEKLSELTCRQNLEKLFEEILGHRVEIEIKLDPNEDVAKKLDVQELAVAFGGEVVS